MSLGSLLIKLNSIKILYESTRIFHENIFMNQQTYIKKILFIKTKIERNKLISLAQYFEGDKNWNTLSLLLRL